jgi:hypothetical protein
MVAGIPQAKGNSSAVLDQSFTSPTGGAADINECCRYVAQTFKAGLTGVLAGINIDVDTQGAPTSRLHVAIRTVVGGHPSTTVLGDTTLASRDAPLSLLITFPQRIAITSGVEYAIVVNYDGAPPPGPGQSQGIWYGAGGDPYTRGMLFLSFIDGVSWWTVGGDVHFQTYVTPLPTSKDQCKNGGWTAFPQFKNQGDCVSFVASGGRNSTAHA